MGKGVGVRRGIRGERELELEAGEIEKMKSDG